jgi:hypothetical protein
MRVVGNEAKLSAASAACVGSSVLGEGSAGPLLGLPESLGMKKDQKKAAAEAVGRRMDASQDAKTEIFAYLLNKEESCPSRKYPVASSSGAPLGARQPPAWD